MYIATVCLLLDGLSGVLYTPRHFARNGDPRRSTQTVTSDTTMFRFWPAITRTSKSGA